MQPTGRNISGLVDILKRKAGYVPYHQHPDLAPADAGDLTQRATAARATNSADRPRGRYRGDPGNRQRAVRDQARSFGAGAALWSTGVDPGSVPVAVPPDRADIRCVRRCGHRWADNAAPRNWLYCDGQGQMLMRCRRRRTRRPRVS